MAIRVGKELISRANTRAEIGARHLTEQEIQFSKPVIKEAEAGPKPPEP